MATMNISMPERMKAFIDAQIRSGEYGSASEFVRKLLRDEQRRARREELEQMLLEGLKSGAGTKLTARDWDRVRAAARKAANSRDAEKWRKRRA